MLLSRRCPSSITSLHSSRYNPCSKQGRKQPILAMRLLSMHVADRRLCVAIAFRQSEATEAVVRHCAGLPQSAARVCLRMAGLASVGKQVSNTSLHCSTQRTASLELKGAALLLEDHVRNKRACSTRSTVRAARLVAFPSKLQWAEAQPALSDMTWCKSRFGV